MGPKLFFLNSQFRNSEGRRNRAPTNKKKSRPMVFAIPLYFHYFYHKIRKKFNYAFYMTHFQFILSWENYQNQWLLNSNETNAHKIVVFDVFF